MRTYSVFRVIVPTEAEAKACWLLALPPGPTIGRKRRARRARGRRIEARQALGHGHWFRVPLDPSRPSLRELAARGYVVAKTTIFSVNHSLGKPWADPSLGQPWREMAGEILAEMEQQLLVGVTSSATAPPGLLSLGDPP